MNWFVNFRRADDRRVRKELKLSSISTIITIIVYCVLAAVSFDMVSYLILFSTIFLMVMINQCINFYYWLNIARRENINLKEE